CGGGRPDRRPRGPVGESGNSRRRESTAALASVVAGTQARIGGRHGRGGGRTAGWWTTRSPGGARPPGGRGVAARRRRRRPRLALAGTAPRPHRRCRGVAGADGGGS